MAFGQVNRLIQQLHKPSDQKVMVAAHRGDWRNAPENSLAAYKLAMQKGVDIIEVDLKMSSDSVLVILHDKTLDRSTTGKGKVSALTFEEIKKLKLKDGLGVPTEETIPSLEEVMLLAKGKVLVNLDHSTPFFVEAINILNKTGTLKQAIFKSDEPYEKLFNRYGPLLSCITFMPVIETDYGGNQKTIDEYQKKLGAVAVELVFSKDTTMVFRNHVLIKTKGSKVWVNSLWPDLCGGHNDDLAVLHGNLEQSWGWLISHGANIIQTDRPAELLAYLRKRKLHD
ncbi:glycerophosphodiester phosphodiesterase [Pedobacter paludis]|uniref:Glycerophosphodiester phosphodiesterase n=2 Tax=Pedobacter paludis TaxID=2203212 RepID=A0A317F1I2_9SPHI|nr:glycerophosphodiester phosphodiesterase [Pedobacter paludis]